MTLVCRQCSRVNPKDATYCYWDGNLLVATGAGGPINAGSAPFPNQFVFPSGQGCRNFDQLSMACQQNWQQAVQLLKQGFFSGFLGGLGRADLALAAQEAANFPDADRGLDQLLAKFPSQVLQPPKIKAEPTEINLGQTPIGSNRTLELHLTNNGMRLAYGSIVSDSKWLTLGDGAGHPQKLFQFGTDTAIPVQVRGQHLRAGSKPLEGQLIIESNGGNLMVKVRAEVPVSPYPDGLFAGAVTPRQIAEKAKANPNGAVSYFEKALVAQWFSKNGWTYPVQGPTVPGVGGVQQFFEALGLAKPPKVELKTPAINLRGDGGMRVDAKIEVTTNEKKVVWAWATSDQPWIDTTKMKSGKSGVINVVIPMVPNRPGETIQAKLHVTSNGNQHFTVPLSLTVGKPSPYGDMMAAVPVLAPAAAVPVEAIPLDAAATIDMVRAVEVMPLGEMTMPAMPSPLAVTPIPVAPIPVAPMPVAPRPMTPMPVTPMPVTPVAVTPVPVMPVPVAPIPVRPVPVQSAGSPFSDLDAPAGAVMPVSVLPVPVSPMPVTPTIVLPSGPPQGGSRIMHLVPLILLALALLGLMLRDLIGKPADGGGSEDIDRTPVVAIEFDHPDRKGGSSNSFGINVVKQGAAAGKEIDLEKRLTFSQSGVSNSTMALVDGQPLVFGRTGGGWVGKPFATMARKKDGKLENRGLATWATPTNIHITQRVELVPGEPIEIAPEVYKRRFDAVLVEYTLENKDAKPHTVGLRMVLDTLIGSNDGTPFTIPGATKLIDTQREFRSANELPDFIQALEKPDLANPETVAQLNFRIGGREPPDRVLLTFWPGRWPKRDELDVWEIPLTDMGLDSCVTMYWNPRELAIGAKRVVGFTYGLGKVTSKDGSLGLSVGGNTTVNGELTVVAYVSKPAPGQTVTIKMDPSLQLLPGFNETQNVPPSDGMTKDGRPKASPITWRVRSTREGTFPIRVITSNGLEQIHRVAIKTRPLF